MRTALLVACLALLCLGGLGTGVGGGVSAADSGFRMDVAETNDVPDRTVEIEGERFHVTEVAQRERGDPLDVDVTAPSPDVTYRLRLYDANSDVVQSRAGDGDGSYTFETSESRCPDCDPGTYMLFLYNTTGPNEERVLATPVVISGYDVTVSVPGSAAAGETVTADVEVQPTALRGQPAGVEVALGATDEDRRVTATHEGGTSYTAEIDLSGLDPATYTVYAGAVGDGTIGDSDEPEVLAISGSRSLEVESASDSGGGGSSGGSGGGGGSSAGGSTTETATPTATPTATATGAGTGTDDTPTRTATATATGTATATAEDVITPNEETETAAATEDDGTAPSPLVLIASLVALGRWARRREQ